MERKAKERVKREEHAFILNADVLFNLRPHKLRLLFVSRCPQCDLETADSINIQLLERNSQKELLPSSLCTPQGLRENEGGERAGGERVRTFGGCDIRGCQVRLQCGVIQPPRAPSRCLSFRLGGESAACVQDRCRGTHKRTTAFTLLPDPSICPLPRLYSPQPPALSPSSPYKWKCGCKRTHTCQKPFQKYSLNSH